VRQITDATGAVLSRHDYLPFGTEWPAPGSGTALEHKVQFAGTERDAESGLDYLGARYFGSQTGRFTRPDTPGIDQHPSDPQSWLLYSYVRNNPLRYTDSTGEKCENGYNTETKSFCTETMGEMPNEDWSQFLLDRLFKHVLTPQVSDFSAGVGDALTGRMIPGMHTSGTEYVRRRMGSDGVVAKSSSSYTSGDLTGGAVGWTVAGSVSATVAAIANGKRGALFGRGGKALFNHGPVRFGWYWKSTGATGRDVIGLRIGPARGTSWWSHIPFWVP
jgi:RHS repeat-associated protein